MIVPKGLMMIAVMVSRTVVASLSSARGRSGRGERNPFGRVLSLMRMVHCRTEESATGTLWGGEGAGVV